MSECELCRHCIQSRITRLFVTKKFTFFATAEVHEDVHLVSFVLSQVCDAFLRVFHPPSWAANLLSLLDMVKPPYFVCFFRYSL